MSFRTLMTTGLIAMMMLGMSGCATTEGIGEDVEALGEKIQDEADELS